MDKLGVGGLGRSPPLLKDTVIHLTPRELSGERARRQEKHAV